MIPRSPTPEPSRPPRGSVGERSAFGTRASWKYPRQRMRKILGSQGRLCRGTICRSFLCRPILTMNLLLPGVSQQSLCGCCIAGNIPGAPERPWPPLVAPRILYAGRSRPSRSAGSRGRLNDYFLLMALLGFWDFGLHPRSRVLYPLRPSELTSSSPLPPWLGLQQPYQDLYVLLGCISIQH